MAPDRDLLFTRLEELALAMFRAGSCASAAQLRQLVAEFSSQPLRRPTTEECQQAGRWSLASAAHEPAREPVPAIVLALAAPAVDPPALAPLAPVLGDELALPAQEPLAESA